MYSIRENDRIMMKVSKMTIKNISVKCMSDETSLTMHIDTQIKEKQNI